MNIRKITEADKPLIDAMIEKDPFHAGLGTSEFYFEPCTEAFWIENEEGGFVVRLARTMRINAAFDVDQRKNNAFLLTEFTKWVAEAAAKSGFREVIFKTNNDELSSFEQRLGFQGSAGEMVMYLEPAAPEASEGTSV